MLLAAAPHAPAQDWRNPGGNSGRNGLTGHLGPTGPDLLWSGGRPSIIAWAPVTAGDRVFMVRQTGFPPGGEPNGSPVVCMNLRTGAEHWAVHIPFNTGDWTTWIAGTSNGLVYASRSGNGASVAAQLYALRQTDGSVAWISADTIDAGAYDGVVFAPDGDLIIASFRKIWRIDADSGATVWVANRTGSVSGNCGGVIANGAVYVCDTVVGGQAIRKHSLATGAFLYQSPVMPGFLVQNSPMAGPDGTIYMHRVQNNVLTDFFYAFADDGASMTLKWSVPAGYSTSSELGVGPDGTVYHWAPGQVIQRLDPATGALLNTSPVIASDFAAPRFAFGRDGIVYFSNGAFSNGVIRSFNADLSARWDALVANINIGAPCLGAGGTLVVCGVGTDVRAYRGRAPCCVDYNNDFEIDFSDVEGFLAALAQQVPGDCAPGADLNGDDEFDFSDIERFLALYNAGC